MADEKKEASGIAAEAGMTGHEADTKEAIEWWHPASMVLSSACTNCMAKLESTGTAAGNDGGANSEHKPKPGGITNAMKSKIVQQAGTSGNETMKSLVKAIKANTDGRSCCAFCGKSPSGNAQPLQACSKCGRTFYCDENCQSRAYGKHKFVCTIAEVQQSEAWFSQNISMPKP